MDVWTARDAPVQRIKVEPQLHVNYQETKLCMKDGLPKMKDVPKEMGGSGLTIAEEDIPQRAAA